MNFILINWVELLLSALSIGVISVVVFLAAFEFWFLFSKAVKGWLPDLDDEIVSKKEIVDYVDYKVLLVPKSMMPDSLKRMFGNRTLVIFLIFLFFLAEFILTPHSYLSSYRFIIGIMFLWGVLTLLIVYRKLKEWANDWDDFVQSFASYLKKEAAEGEGASMKDRTAEKWTKQSLLMFGLSFFTTVILGIQVETAVFPMISQIFSEVIVPKLAFWSLWNTILLLSIFVFLEKRKECAEKLNESLPKLSKKQTNYS